MEITKKQFLKEITSTRDVGTYYAKIIMVPQKWENNQLKPFGIPVSDYVEPNLSHDEMDGDLSVDEKEARNIDDRMRSMVDKVHNEKGKDDVQNDDDGANLTEQVWPNKFILDRVINEDLRVWFGKKKKPKGSSQPKGPWVNICRKDENGKHPPCGRESAKDTAYPKCRAAGVASKMGDAEKKSACQQKRRAEKSHNKSGTGNKPKMVSHKK